MGQLRAQAPRGLVLILRPPSRKWRNRPPQIQITAIWFDAFMGGLCSDKVDCSRIISSWRDASSLWTAGKRGVETLKEKRWVRRRKSCEIAVFCSCDGRSPTTKWFFERMQTHIAMRHNYVTKPFRLTNFIHQFLWAMQRASFKFIRQRTRKCTKILEYSFQVCMLVGHKNSMTYYWSMISWKIYYILE